MCWCHLDVGSEDRVVVDQLVARDVEGGEGGEGCEQRGGQRVQLIVRQAQVRQVGQHAVILASPSENDGGIITELCQADKDCLVIFRVTLAGTLICKRKTQFFHFSFQSVPRCCQHEESMLTTFKMIPL